MSEELRFRLALSLLPGLGYQSQLKLLSLLSEHHVALADFFKDPQPHLKMLQDKVASIKQNKTFDLQFLIPEIKQITWTQVDNALQWQQQRDNHIITFVDKEYPALLKEISVFPPILYAKGNISLLKKPQIAIVGSRNPTPSACRLAHQFAFKLSKAGMVICSGLALGIDAASHQGALANNGATIAVMGTGLERIYPARHYDLAHKIADKGLLLSEFSLSTAAIKSNFPRRNQIISGLSLGTLVVEAAIKSGSLITARQAINQGREVFAIPGSIENPLSKGCHYLIKQGAKLVETPEDILEEIGSLLTVERELDTQDEKYIDNANEMTEQAKCVLSAIDFSPQTIEQIAQVIDLPISQIQSIFSELELNDKILVMSDGKICKK